MLNQSEIICEIYNMQHDLNKLIGRDTINNPNKIKLFFHDYLIALSQEISELIDCYAWKWWAEPVKSNPSIQYNKLLDEKNAKIEIIDIIHFFISLAHILDITPDELDESITRLPESQESVIGLTIELKSTFGWIMQLYTTSSIINGVTNCELIEQNKHTIDDDLLDALRGDVIDMWVSIYYICNNLNMTINDVYDVYKKKWQVNIDRQNNNYDVRTKTEDDNNSIDI